MEWIFPPSVWELWLQWHAPSSPSLRLLWLLMLPHIIWGLWKERNKIIFRDASLSPLSLFLKIVSSIRENFLLVVEKIDILGRVMVFDYDASVASHWKLSCDIAKPLKKANLEREGVV